MSIAAEITRISNAKAALKTAINAKGGSLTNETIDQYAAAVNSLTVGSGSGGGGATNFYKCASVSSATWTGYKAVLSGGKYSYEATLTSDALTFDSSKFTPVVGKTYSADALIEATLWTGIPLNGLIFYEPFTADASAAETGQTYTKTGTITFAMDSTLGCNVATFDGSAYLDIANTDIPSGTSDLSVSYWIKQNQTNNCAVAMIGATNSGYNTCFGMMYDSSAHGSAHGPSDLDNLQTSYNTSGVWEFYTWIRSGNTWTLYKNGTSVSTVTYSGSIVSNPRFEIGRYLDDSPYFYGSLSSFRIYSRALTQAEVTTLYNEH